MIVAKFGGTPMANSVTVNKVIDAIMADTNRKIIVVSAPGKKIPINGQAEMGDKFMGRKVTDLLISAAGFPAGNDRDEVVGEIVGRYTEIANGTGADLKLVDPLMKDLVARLDRPCSSSDQRMDLIKAFGEEWMARMLASALEKRGLTAEYVDPKDGGMVVSDTFGDAQPEDVPTYGNLAALAAKPGVVVFPGFYGYTKDGEIATFKRGGSDLTGSIIAAAAKADVYENFSDVDGIFAADPKNIVNNAQLIPQLTFAELRELSYSGFSVFQDESIGPLMSVPEIQLRVKNFEKPADGGTLVTEDRESSKEHEVVGIAAEANFISIYIEKYLMNREIGFGRKLLQVLEKYEWPFEHMPTGIDSISLVIKKKLEKKQMTDELLKSMLSDFQEALELEGVPEYNDNIALIAIVGEGMKSSIGLAAKATKALSKANVNIEMISQGASEISIVFGVEQGADLENMKKAVRHLYVELIDPSRADLLY